MSNTGLSIASWRSPTDRRRAAILACSILFHVAVLTPLAIGLFAGDYPVFTRDPDVPIFVEMEPRPLLAGETVRKPTLASVAAGEPVPLVGEAVPSVTRDRTRVEEEEDDRRTVPIPRIGSSPLVGSPRASADPWQVKPESTAAVAGRSMRTGAGGCRMMDGRLSPSEQELCDDRFNAAAARAGPLGSRTLTPSEKRRDAQFARDGVPALAGYEQRRRPLSGGIGIVGPGDCPGSNLGTGCAGAHLDPAIRQGARTVVNPGLGSNDLEPMRPIPGSD